MLSGGSNESRPGLEHVVDGVGCVASRDDAALLPPHGPVQQDHAVLPHDVPQRVSLFNMSRHLLSSCFLTISYKELIGGMGVGVDTYRSSRSLE